MARIKGVPNKDKQQLLRALQKIHPEYNPLGELLKIAFEDDTTNQERIMCHKEIAQYVNPKLKAVEQVVDMTVNVPKSITFRVNNGDS